MAYDERLAARVRGMLDGTPHVSERKMFGGLAFLVDGKMAAGIVGDELMVRVGKERYDEALAKPGARKMDFTGRPATGMVYVSTPAIARGASLRRWLDLGVAAAREAPAGPARARRKPVAKGRARKSKGGPG